MPVRGCAGGGLQGQLYPAHVPSASPLHHLLAQLALGHPAQRFLAVSTRCLWKTNHLKVGCLWAEPAPACCLLLSGNGGKAAGAGCVRCSPAPQGTHCASPVLYLGSSRGCSKQDIPQALLRAVELILTLLGVETEVRVELFEPGSSLAGFWHSLQVSTIQRRQCLLP